MCPAVWQKKIPKVTKYDECINMKLSQLISKLCQSQQSSNSGENVVFKQTPQDKNDNCKK